MAELEASSHPGGDARFERWRNVVLSDLYRSEDAQTERTTRDWIVDWTLFVISVALGVFVFIEQYNSFWVLNAMVGLLANVAMFWRRSHPLAFGLIAAFASCVSGAAGAAWLVSLYNSALRLDRKGLVWVLAIGIVGFITYPFLYPPEEGLFISIFFGLGVSGLALGLGAYSRARHAHVAALIAAAEAAEGEQRLREERARQAERHRIAREMHDVLAHRISLLSLHAGALEYREDVSAEERKRTAGVIRVAAQDALQELRDVIGVMRTHADEGYDPPQPEIADIPALIDQFRDAGVRVEFEDEGVLASNLSPAAGRTLYRVVQEGLTNASKHAPGALVRIVLGRRDEKRAFVVVENQLAAGSQLAAVSLTEPGVGLVGLGERVEIVGGKLEYSVAEGARFRLSAEVPVGDE